MSKSKKTTVQIRCTTPRYDAYLELDLKKDGLPLKKVLAEAAKEHTFYQGKHSSVLLNGFIYGPDTIVSPGDKIQVVTPK